MNAIISDFIATHGVRKFQIGESGDYFNIQSFMLQRGYTISFSGKKFTIKGHGKSRVTSWNGMLQFVDAIRTAEGREPPRRAA